MPGLFAARIPWYQPVNARPPGQDSFMIRYRFPGALLAAGLALFPVVGQAQEGELQTPPAEKISNPVAVFSGLDKITGRIISFDVYIDETVQFGALQVTPRVCYSRPPTVAPLTDAFVEVDEITLNRKVRRIFSGWMFADSPGLHAVDHAVYDVWLTDCSTSSSVAPPANR
jgi:hypothetical protein